MTEQRPYHADGERSGDGFARHDRDQSTERERRVDMDIGADSDAYRNRSRDMNATRGNRGNVNDRCKDKPGNARGNWDRGDGMDGRRNVQMRDGESNTDRLSAGRYNKDRDRDRDKDRGRDIDRNKDTTQMRDVDSDSERENGREGMRLSSSKRNKRPPGTRDKRRRLDSNPFHEIRDSGGLPAIRHPQVTGDLNIRVPKFSKRNRSGSDDEPANYSDGILGARDITQQPVSRISPHRRYSSYLDDVFSAKARRSHVRSRSARRTKRPRLETGGQLANLDDGDDGDVDADDLTREYRPPHPTRRQRDDGRGSRREGDGGAGGGRQRSRDRLVVSSDSEAGERDRMGRSSSRTGEQRRAKKLAKKSTTGGRRRNSNDIISDAVGDDIRGARLITEEPPPSLNGRNNAPVPDSANGTMSAAEAVSKKSKQSKRKSKKRAEHRSKSKRDKHRDDANDVSEIVEDTQGVTLSGKTPRNDRSREGVLDSTNPIATTDEAAAVEAKKAKRDRKARKRAKRQAKLAGDQTKDGETNDVSGKGLNPRLSERSFGGDATGIKTGDKSICDKSRSSEDKSDDRAGAKSSGEKSSSDFGKKKSDGKPLVYLDLTPEFNSLNPIAPSSGALRLKPRIEASAGKPRTRASSPSKSAKAGNTSNDGSTGDEGDDESTAMEVSKVLDKEMEDLEQQLSVFKVSEKKAEQATEAGEDNIVNVDEPNQSEAMPGSRQEMPKPGLNAEEPKLESKQEDRSPKTVPLPPTRRSKSKPVRNPTRRQLRLMIDPDVVDPMTSQGASKKKKNKKNKAIFVANKNNNALGAESLRFHACMCGMWEEPGVELDGEQGSIQCGMCGLWSHIKCMRLDKDRLEAFQKSEQQFMCWSCIENMTVQTNDAVQAGGLGGGDVNQTDQVIDVINLDDDDDEHNNKGDDEIVAVNKVVGNDSNTNFNNRDSHSNRATASNTRSINWNNQMMAVHPWNRAMEPRSGRRVAVRSKLSEQQTEERSNNLDAIREGVIRHPTGEREGWLDQKLGIWW